MKTAEAKVMFRNTGTTDWRDSLDFDPITLPVTAFQPGTRIPALTDSAEDAVMSLVEGLELAEADSDDTREYSAVWSDCGFAVKAVCPECGDVFEVADGWIQDFDTSGNGESGITALHCGCFDN